jgi:hypothetical protein
MTSDDWKSRASDLATDVTNKFFVPRPPSEILTGFGGLTNSLSPEYAPPAAAFEQNVSAVLATIGMPVTLALASAERSHWQRIYTAERIRARGLDAEPGENESDLEARRDEHALKSASEKMREYVTSSDGPSQIGADACAFLLRSLDSSDLSAAAAELLLQGTVLTWSALESLSRDLFELILNSDPTKVKNIMLESTTRQRLQSKFTLDELAMHGFDLSSSLGTLLSSQQDFSDIRTIKATMLPALNADATLAAALGDKTLWVLCQQRHLIVHRRGVIDFRYLEATGEQLPTGSRLSVSPSQLESQLAAVVSAGTALLAAAGRHAT